jgi:predicted DNA-binding antitoxin AbrB/MazE fold protein
MTMATAIKAIYEHGVFRPLTPVHLREETEVEVLVPPEAAAEDDDPTGWKTARELLGCITEDLSADDVAANPDRHVYRRDL